ncbi:MAG: hypothetical protein RLZZ601_2150, partial [Pseudomonadota bacterium]
PTVDQTVQILRGLKSRFEEHHSVKYASAALVAAAELSSRYINDRHLPDKAIDVIDEAGAAQRILPKSKQKKTIGRPEIEEIVAKIARIPPQSVTVDDRSKLQTLDRDIKSVVFGQDPAIEALASAIKMTRAGLGKIDRPIGSFLFSGPTGVGKTELVKALAEELIRRKVVISWWGNIRFEKTFTPELCELLAQSGCIAMSGGLEVASDRLLDLMKKGVSVEQVAQVTKGFSDAGILVHAYLMYGFPTQTVQETVDSLEYVRQLFENGCIQSGFFHRFTCTAHSPVGLDPEAYGIELVPLPPISFAKNDVAFIDPAGVDHDLLGIGLKKAIYNFMHGVGFEEDTHKWFDVAGTPKTSVGRNKIAKALRCI